MLQAATWAQETPGRDDMAAGGAGAGLKAGSQLLGAASGGGGGKGGGGGGGGVSQQDIQNVMFENQQGKVMANQFGAQTGTGNYSGVVQALNANDIRSATQLASLNQQQQAAAQAAQAQAQQAGGLLSGATGQGFGSSPASGSFGASSESGTAGTSTGGQ
jgi:hypothetical protein